jgi:BlaI family transcriptional regulator, penicillinase repressor
MTMGRAKVRALSRRERQIMDILFARGEATAAQVQGDMADAPSYSAVRALLTILERKGQVRHREEGERYVYVPAMAREKAAKTALVRVIEVFFGGSVEKAVATQLTDPAVKLSEEEYGRLKTLIEAARRRGE